MADEPPDVLTPAAGVQAAFDRYLQHEPGLTTSTRVSYGSFVGRLLTERFGTNPVELSCLTAADLTAFIHRHAARFQAKTSELMTTALRAFLRFARQRGELTTDLATAAVAVVCGLGCRKSSEISAREAPCPSI